MLLTPILAVYLFQRRRTWYPAWVVVLAAPAAIAIWQIWEWRTRGELPAAVLIGYMHSYSFNKTSNMLRSGIALVVHSGWIVSPLLVIAAFFAKRDKWRWIAAAVATLAAAFYDPNPLFWLSAGCGVLVLSWLVTEALRRDFLAMWAVIFFTGALLIFFAGSARYLLPIAAPVAILATLNRRTSVARGRIRFANDTVVGLRDIANYQHWDGYRQFAKTPGSRRGPTSRLGGWRMGPALLFTTWNRRARCLSRGIKCCNRAIPSYPARWLTPSPANAPVARSGAPRISFPSVPLRLISLSHRSAYSSAAGGLLPSKFRPDPPIVYAPIPWSTANRC